jgi:C4-dicarboxylate-specific signal transduction histidine kinase/ABC-type uncharacterized transport system substrate-binding protein
MANRSTIRHAPGRRARRPGVFLAALLLGLIGTAVAGAAPAPTPVDGERSERSVLLLYGEARALPASLDIDDSVRSRLQATDFEVRFFTEYLDLSWASDPAYLDRLRAFLASKYQSRHIDVIVTVGAPALRFALENRAALFPGVPLVFTAVPPGGAVPMGEGQGVTGVWMAADAAATVDAARRLQPQARRLVVVAGSATQDRFFVEDVRRDLKGRELGVETTYLVGLPMARLRAALAGLSRDAMVLYVSLLRDGDGKVFSTRESLRILVPASGAPIYGLSETMMGQGIVGGRVVSFRAQGTQAADLALRVMRGEAAERMPPVPAPANVFMYDRRELTRWGLREADLPEGSVVINRPPSLWATYGTHLLLVAAVIAAEAALIVMLLVSRRRRRRAEAALRERLAFERLVSELSATLVAARGAEVGPAIMRGLRQVGEHLGVDRASIIEISPERELDFSYVWLAPGIEPASAPVELGEFPWASERLRQGESYAFASLDELPAAAAVDRESYARLGITSSVACPLRIEGVTAGALALSLMRARQAWPVDLIARIDFVGGIFATVLSRRRGEHELRTLRRDLTHVGRVASMGELAASIAHELNQPLTAILSNAQVAQRLLERGDLDHQELESILADIVSDDRRAGSVIRRLRAFVRKDEAQRSFVDMNAVVEDVAGLVRSDAIFRNVALAIALSPRLPIVVGDRIQLQQVVLNLVLNGLDAMKDAVERHLLVTTATDDESGVIVAVSDHGPGVAERDLQRIFEPFYTTKSHGLGMGLAIARSLVESHGGRLRVENNKNGGATFTFTIPAAEASGD